MESDSQLVARAQNRDQQAFEELVRRHSARVFRLAVSVLGREFIPEAEDVAQEVFLKAHHAIESYRGEAEFSSWIYRITFNHAVNVKSRVRFRSPHVDETALHTAAAPEPGPHRQAEAACATGPWRSASGRSRRPTNPPCACTIGWARRWMKRRNCWAFPRIPPNRIYIAHASFFTAC